MLDGKCVVVGVTGGIAAYKTADIVSRLKKLHADVVVIMTRNAQQFITPMTMMTMSQNPVVTDLFERPERWEVEHIALAKRADLFLIAPASANLLAKMAHGIADDMLSTTLLATRAPILLAPAMNTGMWEHPATVENVEILQKRGVRFVGPGEGFLAEGTHGVGRMIENETIIEAAEEILLPRQDLAGRHIVVTAGPTREPLDPVRYLSNRSSGRMGMDIAAAAKARGARVTLLLGPVSLEPPPGVEVLRFETTLELYDLALRQGQEADAVIQAAAPGDFRAERVAEGKIKKSGDEALELRLVQNPDIAKALGERKRPGQVLVAFAAETYDLTANARQKLAKKNADLVVANDVSREGAGFDVPTNIATLVERDGETDLPLMSKRELADRILDRVAKMLGKTVQAKT